MKPLPRAMSFVALSVMTATGAQTPPATQTQQQTPPQQQTNPNSTENSGVRLIGRREQQRGPQSGPRRGTLLRARSSELDIPAAR